MPAILNKLGDVREKITKGEGILGLGLVSKVRSRISGLGKGEGPLSGILKR